MSTQHFNPQRKRTLCLQVMISAALLTLATSTYANTEANTEVDNFTGHGSHAPNNASTASTASTASSAYSSAHEPHMQANENPSSRAAIADPELKQPIQLVQSFVETMDYHLLSDADKEVWDEETWNQIQSNAGRSNQVRLAEEHPFYELERLARAHVIILAKDAERAEDGSVRVITEMTYPYVLMLIDEYVETDSSFAFEQLREFNQTLEDDALDVAQLEVYRSSMPWRVRNDGVFVDAAQMQENRESLQAQGW